MKDLPNSIPECIKRLDRLIPEKEKIEISQMKEMDFIVKAHFGLGLWIRNKWLHPYESELYSVLKEEGHTEPDGMSGTIMREFHTYLKSKRQ